MYLKKRKYNKIKYKCYINVNINLLNEFLECTWEVKLWKVSFVLMLVLWYICII